MRGRFITFEGVEGCGKSTQQARLVRRLRSLGNDVLATREPGGTPVAEALRAVVLAPEHAGLGAEAELLILAAARADHVRRVLAPALAVGRDVACDRFSDSTRAYQVGGRGLAEDVVERVDALAAGGLRPDLTLLLDLPAEVGLRRVRERAGADSRFDAEALGFHRRVRSAFLRIAGQEPERVVVVDATPDADEVERRVLSVVVRLVPELAS